MPLFSQLLLGRLYHHRSNMTLVVGRLGVIFCGRAFCLAKHFP